MVKRIVRVLAFFALLFFLAAVLLGAGGMQEAHSTADVIVSGGLGK